MNKSIYNLILLVILGVYVVSPVDFVPGPVDDFLAILLYLATNKHNMRINSDITEIDK